jgi:hypothetical protein
MPPRTRRARQAHNNHTSMGLNNTLLSDTMHANVVDRVGDEGQPLPVATHPRTKAIGTSNTISEMGHMLIMPSQTYLSHPG